VQALSSQHETEWLLDYAKSVHVVGGVVGWVDLTAADVADEIGRLCDGAGRLLVGFRHSAQSEADPRWLNRKDVARGLRAIEAIGRVFDLLVLPPQLPAAIDVVTAFPNLRFVLDHLGKPPIAAGILANWERDLRELARRPNVSAKLSGLVTEASWKAWTLDDLRRPVELALELFGPKRLMFGSDWPVCTLAADYSTVVETVTVLVAHLTDDEQTDIWCRTAASAYSLGASRVGGS